MPKNVRISKKRRESSTLLLLRTHLEIVIQLTRSKERRFVVSCGPTPSTAARLFISDFFTIMEQYNYKDDKHSPSYTETQALLSHEEIAPTRHKASRNRWPLILLGLNCFALLVHTILLVLGYSDQKCFSYTSEVSLPSHGQSDPEGAQSGLLRYLRVHKRSYSIGASRIRRLIPRPSFPLSGQPARRAR